MRADGPDTAMAMHEGGRRTEVSKTSGIAYGPAASARARVVLGLLLGVLLAPAAQSATYKWVDDKGVVHYTDKIPPDAVNKGSTVLDKQARPVKKIDPALTAEQRRALEAEEEQKRLQARAAEEVARRDRALMSSYTTEAEIDLARTRALGTIDAQLESAQGFSAQLRKRREELDKRRPASGEKLPVAVERELESNEVELARQARLIEQKQAERNAAIARYEADKARWRELRALADANAAATRGSPGAHPATATSAGSGGARK